MIRSLTIKFVLLAGVLGFLMVLGWPNSDQGEKTRVSSKAESSPPVALMKGSPEGSVESPTEKDLNSDGLDEFPKPRGIRTHTIRIDLNLSTAQELESLPGVGPTLAERIIEYRTKLGGFSSINSLEQVKGIGPKKLQVISPLVTVHPNIVAEKS
ncbi:helix-hairpin-helix domain-containing protein [Candidatus Nitronereus thalassa]|uniref:Helix-hairpin-helix domain-containing protein n=1 Tax=Candidatus Nitronereus thalassa TaxID=3020898 RepID=A0ABU3K4I4_9BACT|nr:helix-hairpin-helix domain-containing protein [Candidatus Nitronereus thalassa]MDT7041278.1 helix-hairpin-helix domain-containing protein [Candidatus Nitronereus thalassa]